MSRKNPFDFRCQHCQKSLDGFHHRAQRKYCSRTCWSLARKLESLRPEIVKAQKERYRQYSRNHRLTLTKEAKAEIQTYNRTAHREKKQQAVEYMGGQCFRCEYSLSNGGCIAAFDFHHRDPKEKDFDLLGPNGNLMFMRRWVKILPELEKCDLLCRNCHATLHFEEN